MIGVALFGALIAGPDRLIAGLHLALAISVALSLLVAAISVVIGAQARTQQ